MSRIEIRELGTIDRREFIGRTVAGTAAVVGGLALPGLAADEATAKRTAVDLVALGKSKVKVTRLGIGTGSNGGSVQRALGQEEFTRLVRHAWDRGVRFVDTADMYKIHDLVGKAIKGLPRDQLAIQSKIMWEQGPDVAETLDRFRRELGVEYLDTCLIHCATKPKWPDALEKMRDDLSTAKEKGIVRAHGVSCHGLPALREVAACAWVDVNLARINPMGHKVDGDTESWNEPGKVGEACAEIEKIHKAGKGVIGMKIVGNGDFTDPAQREKSVRFAMTRPYVDAVIIGVKSPAEVDEAIERMNRALAG
jgi:aryl-alcohol dehydrogenase-like predicted oxidoreductase